MMLCFKADFISQDNTVLSYVILRPFCSVTEYEKPVSNLSFLLSVDFVLSLSLCLSLSLSLCLCLSLSRLLCKLQYSLLFFCLKIIKFCWNFCTSYISHYHLLENTVCTYARVKLLGIYSATREAKGGNKIVKNWTDGLVLDMLAPSQLYQSKTTFIASAAKFWFTVLDRCHLVFEMG